MTGLTGPDRLSVAAGAWYATSNSPPRAYAREALRDYYRDRGDVYVAAELEAGLRDSGNSER